MNNKAQAKRKRVARTPESGSQIEGETDVRVAYRAKKGVMVQGLAENALRSSSLKRYKGKVQLLFTSPPFPLQTKKQYGNMVGKEYLDWLSGLAPLFAEYLTPDGSIVIELGNAWEPGQPVMSVLGLQALLQFRESGKFHLCQQFICENPARLPGPAQWVNVERMRVKDSFSHVWWMSPVTRPKADNRQVLNEYSVAMKALLKRGKYNSGARPSDHLVSKEGFLKQHAGSIPSNVLRYSNTVSQSSYQLHCRAKGIRPHPARMPEQLAEFFIKLLTQEGDVVLDPFAGSNTTGAAAARLGRKWISIEPRDDYIRGSVGRFQLPHPKLKRLKRISEKKTPKKTALR